MASFYVPVDAGPGVDISLLQQEGNYTGGILELGEYIRPIHIFPHGEGNFPSLRM